MPLPKLIKGGDSRKNWQAINATVAETDRLWIEVRRLSAELAALRNRPAGVEADDYHPFRVYHSRSGHTDPVTNQDGWRKFIVRAGRVGTIEVTGTDGVSDPYSRRRAASSTTGEILVPADEAAYPIWVEYLPGSAAASINHDSYPDSGDWPGYPGDCTTEGTICILIATVDTTQQPAVVRQIVREDLPDFYQACVNVGGVEKVLVVRCTGQPFSFVV